MSAMGTSSASSARTAGTSASAPVVTGAVTVPRSRSTATSDGASPNVRVSVSAALSIAVRSATVTSSMSPPTIVFSSSAVPSAMI